MFERSRLIVLSLLVGLSLSFVVAPMAKADDTEDLLKVIPSDAWGFALSKSMDNIEAKAKQLNAWLDLGFPPSVLAEALAPLQLDGTLDMDRPFAVVAMDVNQYGMMQMNEAFVIVVPASKPKALLEKLQAKDVEGADVKSCLIMDVPAFAMAKGKYIIVGPSQTCVAAVGKAKKGMIDGMPNLRRDELKKADLSICIAMKTLVDAYQPMIMGMLPMLAASAGQNLEQLQMQVAMFQQMSSFDLTVKLNEKGVALGMILVPVEGTDFDKVMKDTKTSKDSSLAMLPKEAYLFALGGTGTYSKHNAVFGGDKIVSNLLSQPSLGLMVPPEVLKEMDTHVVELMKSLKQWAFGVSPLADKENGLFGCTIVLKTENAKKYLNTMRAMWEAGKKVEGDASLESVKKAFAHTPDAETIGGLKVDTVKINLADLADTAAYDPDTADMLGKLFGKDLTLRFGAADDEHLVLVFGGGQKRYEQICTALKAKDGGLAKDTGITKISSLLPSPRSSEGYLAVDNLIQTIKSTAKELGEEEEFPFELPKLDAPVAFAMGGADGIAVGELIIPVELIKAAKAAYDQFAAKPTVADFDEVDDEAADVDDDAKTTGDDGDEDEGEDEEF